jgi:hypothetical protein
MTKSDLKNKIGFQMNFVLYSGLEPDAAIENIVEIAEEYKSSNLELIKAEAIQSYLLERGANDEGINDEVLILKGLKVRIKKSECNHTLITSADWKYQSCSKCGFKVQIVNEK